MNHTKIKIFLILSLLTPKTNICSNTNSSTSKLSIAGITALAIGALGGFGYYKYKQYNDQFDNKKFSLSVSPDSQFVAISNGSKIVKIWNIGNDGSISQYSKITLQGEKITSVAFKPNSVHDFLLTGSDNDIARFWEVKPNTSTKTSELKNPKKQIGKFIAVSDDYAITHSDNYSSEAILWNIESAKDPKPLKIIQAPNTTKWLFIETPVNFSSFIIDAKHRKIIAGTIEGFVIQWKIKKEKDKEIMIEELYDKRFKNKSSSKISNLAADPSGSYVVIGTDDKTASILDIDEDGNVDTEGDIEDLKERIVSMGYYVNDETPFVLTCFTDNSFNLWDTSDSDNHKKIFSAKIPSDKDNTKKYFFNSMSFSPNGKYIISNSHDKSGKPLLFNISELLKNKKQQKCRTYMPNKKDPDSSSKSSALIKSNYSVKKSLNDNIFKNCNVNIIIGDNNSVYSEHFRYTSNPIEDDLLTKHAQDFIDKLNEKHKHDLSNNLSKEFLLNQSKNLFKIIFNSYDYKITETLFPNKFEDIAILFINKINEYTQKEGQSDDEKEEKVKQ